MKTLLGLLLFCSILSVQAQAPLASTPSKARNTFYVEGLGSGGFYSINYERLVLALPNHAYGFRVGTAYHGIGSVNLTLALVGEAMVLVGKGNHHGDFGMGISVLRSDYQEGYRPLRAWNTFAIPRLSYRYQRPTGGLMLRAGFTPAIQLGLSNQTNITPWAGGAIGYSF